STGFVLRTLLSSVLFVLLVHSSFSCPVLCSRVPLTIHSFPTRRSSDLIEQDGKLVQVDPEDVAVGDTIVIKAGEKIPLDGVVLRSEEHTSELQSRFDLVCRLLLEKKNSAVGLGPNV